MTNNGINVCRYGYSVGAIGILSSLLLVFALVSSFSQRAGHAHAMLPECRVPSPCEGGCREGS